jgi:hypothetical protein
MPYLGVEGAGAERKEELKRALDAMGAKWSDKIQIDTTHFVCTTSLSLTAVSRNVSIRLIIKSFLLHHLLMIKR